MALGLGPRTRAIITEGDVEVGKRAIVNAFPRCPQCDRKVKVTGWEIHETDYGRSLHVRLTCPSGHYTDCSQSGI